MPSAGTRRGKYLGFVAHEIKNPLATALWSCDLLKRMDQADRAGPRAEKMIDASLRALRRMRRLVDDYFTIERLHEHGYDLRRDTVELRAVVEGAMATLSEKDGISTQGWAVDVAAQAQVSGDPEMLKRALRMVFEHLAKGGAKAQLAMVGHALASGSELVVRSSEPPQPLLPPVPEERPSGDPAGTVLGFALAAAILDAHGGTLQERDGALVVQLPKK